MFVDGLQQLLLMFHLKSNFSLNPFLLYPLFKQYDLIYIQPKNACKVESAIDLSTIQLLLIVNFYIRLRNKELFSQYTLKKEIS